MRACDLCVPSDNLFLDTVGQMNPMSTVTLTPPNKLNVRLKLQLFRLKFITYATLFLISN